MASIVKVPHGSPGADAFSWLKIDDLHRDPSINPRPLDETRAERMAQIFDPDAFGVISVSLRTDGRHYIIDGQHRCHMLRSMGWNGQKIPCAVFRNLSKEQEAALFVMLNNFKSIRIIDKFMSRIAAKEPIATEINAIVQSQGLVIDRVKRDGTVCAAKAIEDIYLGRGQKIKGKNPAALKGTLIAVCEAWGKTAQAVDGQVLAGVGAFLLRYGDRVKLSRLIDKLRNLHGGPTGLINRGAGKRELHGGSIASGIGHFLQEEYNRGLSSRSLERLANWR